MKLVSIVVPTYRMNYGLSEKFLIELLSNVSSQTYKNIELIISDQSDDYALSDICNSFKMNCKFSIIYTRNENKKNCANNVNNAIKYVNGDIVKFLFMDDFFVCDDALEKIVNAYSVSDKKWLISGFIRCDEEKKNLFSVNLPNYNNPYVNGDNSTGNPSNFSCLSENILEMDENLKWLVDGEYYYRNYVYNGIPIMLNDILIGMRYHKDSCELKPEFKNLDEIERKYCENKYRIIKHD